MRMSEPGRGKGQDKGLKGACTSKEGGGQCGSTGVVQGTAMRDGTGGNRAGCCREGLCFYPGTGGKPPEGFRRAVTP